KELRRDLVDRPEVDRPVETERVHWAPAIPEQELVLIAVRELGDDLGGHEALTPQRRVLPRTELTEVARAATVIAPRLRCGDERPVGRHAHVVRIAHVRERD